MTRRLILLCLLMASLSVSLGDDEILPRVVNVTSSQVELPGEIGRRAIGGAGRYLVISIPEQRQIAVFDIEQAKIVKYLPAEDRAIHVAAGADKLIVVMGEKRIISRYSLETFERELTSSLEASAPIASICMGSGSQGPLAIATHRDLSFWNIDGLEKLNVETDKNRVRWNNLGRIEASQDGQTFLVATDYACIIRFLGDDVQTTVGPKDVGSHPRLCPSGRFVHSSDGTFSLGLHPIHSDPPQYRRTHFRVPGAEGEFFLRFNTQKRRAVWAPYEDIKVALYHTGASNPIAGVLEIREFQSPYSFFLIPSSKLLLQAPIGDDKIQLHQLDARQLLDASGEHYLYVSSPPPHATSASKQWQHQLEVRSSAGGLNYQLGSAPEGMTVSPQGLLQWDVPKEFGFSTAQVVVEITDKDQQRISYTFAIRTGGTMGSAPEGISPAIQVEKLATSDGSPALPRITPLKMEAEEIMYPLPAEYDEIKVGGGGRYLVLHFKSLDKLGVFDVCLGTMIGYVTMPRGNAQFAAGANHLVVISDDQKEIKRYGLPSLKLEATGKFRSDLLVHRAAMGHSSDEAVFVDFGNAEDRELQLRRYDIDTFLASDINVKGHRFSPDSMTVSGNGDTLCIKAGSVTRLLVAHGTQWKHNRGRPKHSAEYGNFIASADGRFVFTSDGIKTNRLQEQTPESNFVYSVATSGDFYLRSKTVRTENSQAPANLTVHKLGDDRTLAELPYPPLFMPRNRATKLEEMVFFNPEAKVVVLTPSSKSYLLLKRFDLDAILKASEEDYLYVHSDSSQSAEPGESIKHKIDARSSRGGVSLELLAAPEGATLSDEGQLSWTIPTDFAEASARVTVAIKDDSEKELLHQLTIYFKENEERLIDEATERARLEHERRILESKRREQERMLMQLQADTAKFRASVKKIQESEAMIAKDERDRPFPPDNYQRRSWTDRNGEVLKARFVGSFADSITLRLDNGSQISLPIAGLSDEDQAYVEHHASLIRNADKLLQDLKAKRLARLSDAEERQKLEYVAFEYLKLILEGVYPTNGRMRIPNIDLRSKTSMLSWRVHLLPFIGEKTLFDEFHHDEPWYSEHNKKLIDRMPELFRAPGSNSPPGKSHYVLVGTCDPSKDPTNWRNIEYASMNSGASQQALFIEVPDPLAITWTRPDNIVLQGEKSIPSLKYWFGQRDDCMLVAFRDGSVRKVKSSNDLRSVWSLFYPLKSGEKRDIEYQE